MKMNAKAIVSDICKALAEPASFQNGHMAALATSLAGAWANLSNRAMRCRELLNAGRRAEALQVAREGLDLQSELAALEFPQLPQWLDLCEREGLELPQVTDTGAMHGIVDDVYHGAQDTEKMLRMYRRMSMGRAPLVDRLRKLRELCKSDPSQELWRKDVATFEQARLEELALAAERADQKGDLATLESVLAELSAPAWVTAPPPQFVQAISQMLAPHRAAYAGMQYTALATALEQALAREDEAACGDLLEQVAAVQRQTQVQPESPLKDRCDAARQWLSGQAEYRLLCEQVEQALREAADIEPLEALSLRAGRGGQHLPREMQQRLDGRLAMLRGRRRRRTRMKAVFAGCGAVVIVAAGVALWIHHERMEQIRSFDAQVAAMVAAGQFDQAEGLLQEIRAEHPGAYESATIRSRGAELARQRDVDAARQADLRRAIDRMSRLEAGSGQYASGLAQAAELVRFDDERQVVEALAAGHRRAEQAAQRTRDEAFGQKLAELKGLAAAAMAAHKAGGDEFPALAQKAMASVTAAATAEGVSADLRNQRQGLQAQLASAMADWERTAANRERVKADLAKIAGLYDDPAGLAAALEQFRKDHPQHELSVPFATAIGMSRHYQADKAWRDLRKALPADGNQPQSAQKLLAQVQQYLKDNPGSAHGSAATLWGQYLTAAAASRDGDELKHLRVVRGMLLSPVATDVEQIRLADGRSYYLPRGTKLEQVVTTEMRNGQSVSRVTGYRFRYIVDGQLALSAQPATVKVEQVAHMPRQAPQAALAAGLYKRLQDASRAGKWETLYLQMAQEVRTAKDVDVVVQAAMLKVLLQAAAQTTPFVEQDVAALLKNFEGVNLDVPWMSPDDESANALRGRLERLISGIDSLSSLVEKVESKLGAMRAAAPAPAGVLLSENGKIKLPRVAKKASLHVIAAGDGAAKFQKVADTVDGSYQIRPSAECPLGSVLYVLEN